MQQLVYSYHSLPFLTSLYQQLLDAFGAIMDAVLWLLEHD